MTEYGAVFQKEAPEIDQAFGKFRDTIYAQSTLDAKTQQLIYIAIRASEGDGVAVGVQTGRAKKAGATWEEVRDTIMMTMITSGMKGIMHCLKPASDSYNNT